MWQSVWNWLKSPLKELGKATAKAILQEAGDKLQEEVKKFAAAKGPVAVDAAFDKFQVGALAAVKFAFFLSASMKAKVNAIIQSEGDVWQAKIKGMVEQQDYAGLDIAFDAMQDLLKVRIDSL